MAISLHIFLDNVFFGAPIQPQNWLDSGAKTHLILLPGFHGGQPAAEETLSFFTVSSFVSVNFGCNVDGNSDAGIEGDQIFFCINQSPGDSVDMNMPPAGLSVVCCRMVDAESSQALSDSA